VKRALDRKAALPGLLFNLTYGLYTGWVGAANRSWWFVTLAAYYIILAAARFGVLLSADRNSGDSASFSFIMRFTGILFLFLSVILAGTTYLSLYVGVSVAYHEIVMITIALYTFSKLTLAIINLAGSIKRASPPLKTLRNISFADSLVSIFSLQRSMLVSFGGISEEGAAIFNALTGSAVYIIVFLLGLNLIGGKTINMAKSKLVKANEKISAAVTGGYKKIENGVTEGYRKIEDGVVEGYTKIEDKFIDRFLTREGETLQQAKDRIKKENRK